MPRRAQLALPSIHWHIIQRRNNRAVCFHAEEDYQLYLHYLNEFSDKFGGADTCQSLFGGTDDETEVAPLVCTTNPDC
jgi:hypothetical protein